ncbi:hypothetical protein [Neptunomonas antarctica]|uniref:Cobalamin ABC transporter n=1 Tax=Neptunomonas antarctica TaxID=619304 RepID=A0A1N7NEQ9_9GAMM|nr:hypothetical protein [Neptunomonas antarctica]SIS96758.1 hypothetical protein SAMN05421760_10960 [Neptunomonas antarctica]
MINIQPRSQLMIGAFLILLMAVTRGHHFASIDHLPSASWAIFFLAGVYLKPLWSFPLLILEAFLLDFAAITFGGVSSFCVTPTYVMLIPAYASLWAIGRWYAVLHCEQWKSLPTLLSSLVLGTFVCQLISSGSFYFYSGRYTDPTMVELLNRLIKYTPPRLEAVFFYVGCAVAVHLFLAWFKRTRHSGAETL